MLKTMAAITPGDPAAAGEDDDQQDGAAAPVKDGKGRENDTDERAE